MLIPTIIMGTLAIIFLFIGHYKGQGQHISGIKSALNMTVGILPLLIFSFIVAGMVQVLLPQEVISKWVGSESGIRGIFIGMAAGSLPVAAGLLRCGAGIGTMVAFLTAWSLWSVARLPMAVGILGWKVTLIHVVCTFFFPPIAGLTAHIFFAGVK